MNRKFLCFVFLFFIGLTLFCQAAEEYYFRFPDPGRDDLNLITTIISIDAIRDGYVYAYSHSAGLAKFVSAGYSYEMLPHPGTLYRPQMSDDPDRIRELEAYPTYETYVTMMNQFAVDYPAICQTHNIGYSVNGRELLVVKISDNVSLEENEPEFFYTSTMHGDETTGYILMLNLINHLLTGYQNNSRITNLIDNLEIWINPLANPDGTYYGGNNTVFGARRSNANSVDLNRNFPDPLSGPHPDGNEWQPETIAMMEFASSRSFTMGANLHGGVEVMNYPWDTWPRLHADDEWYIYTSTLYASTAQANSPTGYMTYLNNGITNGYQWYCVHGTRQDYMNYFQRSREITMELSNVKLLPENQLLNYWNYNREALILYIEQSLFGIHGLVLNQWEEPVHALITVLDHDLDNSEIHTDPDVGDYHRLLAPGIYTLQFSAYGYLPQIFEGITVAENAATILDVVLEQAPQFTISGIVRSGNDNFPLENVQLELLDTPIAPIFTNSAGEYQIPAVYQGSYSVYLSLDNYANMLMEIAVDENHTTFNFVLYECGIESFESGDFTSFDWTFPNGILWQIDTGVTQTGDYAARSGAISHNQSSGISLAMNVTIESELSFYLKVSSEQNYDFLKFYLDGEQKAVWSGEVDWQQQKFIIPSGSHTFLWIYQKDGSLNGGSDCAWLDYISFPCTLEVNTVPSPDTYMNKLYKNYPNPFNPDTIISFQLKSDAQGKTELAVYNLRGQKIRTLIKADLSAGEHQVVWDGRDDHRQEVASGVYFYKIESGKFSSVKKMMLIK